MSETKIIARADLPEDYEEMMRTEQHHSHEIIEDGKGTLRWKENKGVNQAVDMVGLNNMIGTMLYKGITKNDEVYRSLYRDMGYSLSGYWEVFYWEMNNEDAEEYQPPTIQL